MAIPADIERKRNFMVEQVEASELDPAVKEEVIQNLTSTAAATNGFTQEEKIQSISINQFDMARSDARIHLSMASGFKRIEEKLAAMGPTTRLGALVKCRWQLMILGLAAIVALILKPELRDLVNAIPR